jgi:hypothetical protein
MSVRGGFKFENTRLDDIFGPHHTTVFIYSLYKLLLLCYELQAM